MKFLRPDNKVDMRQIFEQRIATRLGHAAEKTKNNMRPLFGDLAKHSHFAKRFLIGHVAHAASVEQHDIGFVFAFNPLVTAGDERVCDLFGIALVHLATVGFDEELRHGRAK